MVVFAGDREEAMRFLKLGWQAYKQGNYLQAIEYYKKSEPLFRKLGDLKGEALSLFGIGSAYRSLGQYIKALKYYKEELKIRRKLNRPQTIATTLFRIGSIYRSLGKYRQALRYYREALKIDRELNMSQYIADDFNSIGVVYHSLGRYSEALRYLKEALKIRRELNIPQSVATTLNNIGAVYSSLGQYSKALRYHQEALKIRRELNIPQGIATALLNIGFVYFSLGQYSEALKYYKEALKIFRELNIPRNIATTLNGIGEVYYFLGQYSEALRYYKEALKIRRELNIPQDIAQSLNNIGLVYASLGQYSKALKYYREALKIDRELNISQYIAAILENIGAVYLSLGLYDKAEENLRESDLIWEKIGIRWVYKPYFVELYLAKGQPSKAFKELRKRKPSILNSPLFKIRYYTQLGLALNGLGKFNKASYSLLKAVALTEELRSKVKEKRTGFFIGGFYGGFIKPYRALITALGERVLSGERKDPAFSSYGKDLSSALYYFAESCKARTLLEGMAEAWRQKRTASLPPKLREKEQSLLSQLSAIEKQWEKAYREGKEEVLKELASRREKLQEELSRFISLLRRQYPLYASLYYPKPVKAEELLLREDEVVIEYAFGTSQLYAAVLEKGGVKKVLKLSSNRKALEEKIKSYLQEIQQRVSSQSRILSLGHELYSELLSPAIEGIPYQKHVIIIPDGILGVVPFEALVVEDRESFKGSVYAGDLWKISYYQSAAILHINRSLGKVGSSKPLFALGNPSLGREVVLEATRRPWGDAQGKVVYAPLPETEQEVRAIARIMGVEAKPPDVLLRDEAREEAVKEASLRRYRILHFATHADLPGKVQGIMEPFIILSQVNKSKEDGFLTLSEVLSLKLDAELVVLSACVTGRGKVMEGEGVVNFARAFHHAGARSVVVSLWEVASLPAVEFMEEFYRRIKQGESKLEALRKARSAIRAKHPHPFYWAVFILHGEE